MFFKIKQRAIKEIYDNPQGFTVVKKWGRIFHHQEMIKMIEEDGEYDCIYDLWVIGGHYYGVDNYMRFNARSREELGVDASEEDVVQHSKKLLYDLLSSFWDDECKWSSKDSKILRDAIGEGHSIIHIQQHIFNRKWAYNQLQKRDLPLMEKSRNV